MGMLCLSQGYNKKTNHCEASLKQSEQTHSHCEAPVCWLLAMREVFLVTLHETVSSWRELIFLNCLLLRNLYFTG